MPLAEDQDMIQTVAPDRPDQALSIRGYRDLRGSDPAQLFVRSLMPAISGRSNAGRKSAWEQLTTILAARGVGSRPHPHLSCRKAEKARIFMPVWNSTGESRLKL
jgi:hypothetical protein